MFGRGVFLKGKNFHSIAIVVPLQVSNFHRVLKKLTADDATIRHSKLSRHFFRNQFADIQSNLSPCLPWTAKYHMCVVCNQVPCSEVWTPEFAKCRF
jgi:hypothetical protein